MKVVPIRLLTYVAYIFEILFSVKSFVRISLANNVLSLMVLKINLDYLILADLQFGHIHLVNTQMLINDLPR